VYFRQTSKQNLLDEVLRKVKVISIPLNDYGKKLLLEKTIFMNVVSTVTVRRESGKLYCDVQFACLL
jgi:hypothetical protein